MCLVPLRVPPGVLFGLLGVLLGALTACTVSVGGTAVRQDSRAGSTADDRPAGLAGLLLSLDEMKKLLAFSELAREVTWTRPESQGVFDPPECVGAVFSSMTASYRDSGYRDFFEVRLQDRTASVRDHWVDEGVVEFADDAAARAFVARQTELWHGCAGKRFRYAYPNPQEWQESYRIGEPVDAGCATVLNNVIEDDDQRYEDVRLVAAKDNVVVDLQFTGFELTDEPLRALNQILQRVSDRGRDCVFQA